MTTCLSLKLRTHPVFTHLQDIWKTIAKIFKENVYLNSEASIWQNPALRINKAPFMWQLWLKCGITTLGDLYNNDILKSFEDLKQEFHLPQECFWQYLQLRHLLKSVFSPPITVLNEPSLIKDLLKMGQINHSVSKYYSKLIQQNCILPTILKKIWEKDLKMSFTESEWNKIGQNFRKLSRDVRVIRLIQFKIVNRYYWTPMRLYRLGLKNTPNCWKCHSSDGTMFHALWQCPKTLEYWNRIHSSIEKITGDNFELSPRLYVLGDPAIVENCQNTQFIQTAIMIGRQVLLREWKNPRTPPYNDWFCELGRVASYEQLFYRMNDRWNDYEEKWRIYYSYISQ